VAPQVGLCSVMGSLWVSGAAGAMPSVGLAGWNQAGQQCRRTLLRMASMGIGIRETVGDMSEGEHMPFLGQRVAPLSRSGSSAHAGRYAALHQAAKSPMMSV
jgi:hypothetical protein